MDKRGRTKLILFLAFTAFIVASLYFVFASSDNLASSTAGNGTTIRVLWFNVTNLSSDGNTLTSVTINQTVVNSSTNVTNITVSNGTVFYNASCCTFPVIINIGGNITSSVNFTVNFTINASAGDAATIQANVTAITNDTNVSYSTLPYNSTIITIDTREPFLQYGSGTTSSSNLSQSFIYLNISANDTVSNLHSIVIYRYNSTDFNSSINSSLSATRAIHTFNFTGLADGTYYINATVNDTYNHVNASATRTIVLDTVVPTVSLPNYVNGSNKKNTVNLTLNISVTDATSGFGNGLCVVNVNGTNQSISVSSGWCNSTGISLVGLADGNQTINVYVNDSANNVKLNNSFVVQIDTTAPSASASCSPSTVQVGASFPCTCSGSDATSGINTSSGTSDSPDGTSAPSSTGSFTYTCSATDNAGNSASATASYTVELAPSSSGGSGGGSSAAPSFWTKGTYAISEEQFTQGHSTGILTRQRVKIKISNEDHYVGVKEVTQTTAKIEVSSTPQEKTLSTGEEWKAEVTGDNYYDLSLKLNSVDGSKANVFIKSIYELIPETEDSVQEPVEETAGQPTITGEATEGESGNMVVLWIVIIILVVAFITWFFVYRKKHKKY